MNASRSSAAVEDYLERILELINTKGYARVVDIATSLGISQASVTNMVQRLDGEGLPAEAMPMVRTRARLMSPRQGTTDFAPQERL